MAPSDRASGGGWGEAARQVLGSLVDIGHTRIELAAVELAEERLRIARLCVGAVLTLFLLGVGLLLAVAWIVLWCEPAQRLAALGGLAALFLAAAAYAAWRWRELSTDAPPLLQATLAELDRDRAAWANRSAP
jgi:uncharacterized membrane protein YqjE